LPPLQQAQESQRLERLKRIRREEGRLLLLASVPKGEFTSYDRMLKASAAITLQRFWRRRQRRLRVKKAKKVLEDVSANVNGAVNGTKGLSDSTAKGKPSDSRSTPAFLPTLPPSHPLYEQEYKLLDLLSSSLSPCFLVR